jgi:hypothetical protein
VSWLRLDDNFAQHPKFEGWLAPQRWAFLELMLWCAKYRTKGRVSTDLTLLPRSVSARLLGQAEAAGWLDRDELGTLWIHDWEKYNPTDSTGAERQRKHRERNAESNADSVTDAVTETVTVTGPRARARVGDGEVGSSLSLREGGSKGGTVARQELEEVLARELGTPMTRSEHGRRGKAIKELREIGATGEDVRRKCESYRTRWPNVELTAMALINNWSQLDRPVPSSANGLTSRQLIDAARERE